jgi:serine/threonine protein kinase
MNCHPERHLYSKKKQSRGLNKVGAGKYGTVSVGCTKKSCRFRIAVKKSLDDMSHEYKMMKRAYRVAPEHVVEPYHFVNCKPVGSIIYSEYIDGPTLKKYKVTKSILIQVLTTLYKFQKHGIRHNDLHLENILIEKDTHRAVISDFGFANSSSFLNSYGIHPKNDSRYDYHFFLNTVYRTFPNSEAGKFVSYVLPSEYLGRESSKINNYRLRYGVDHSDLPSLSKILSYFKKNNNYY